MAKKKPTNNAWRSRIVAHKRVAPSELLPHEMNHRRHPEQQKAVVAASIRELGFVRSVIVNQRTGKIIDGHERVAQALAAGIEEIDVEYVDLSEDEERKALLMLDASSEMATVDSQSLDDLLRHVQTGEEAIASMMESMAIDAGLVEKELKPVEVNSSVNYAIQVAVASEFEQAAVIRELEERGLKCVPLML